MKTHGDSTDSVLQFLPLISFLIRDKTTLAHYSNSNVFLLLKTLVCLYTSVSIVSLLIIPTFEESDKIFVLWVVFFSRQISIFLNFLEHSKKIAVLSSILKRYFTFDHFLMEFEVYGG